jgi:hypothetical protein
VSPGHDDVFADRRKALEEEFFRKADQRLVEQLRAKQEKTALRESLTQLGVSSSDSLVDALFDQSVTPQALAALTLVPLVLVAWADGSIDQKEKSAILQAAASLGVPSDGPGYALLQTWLENKPPAKLIHTWESYAAALATNLSPAQRDLMKADIVDRARKVAEAAGGFLGLGSKVSVSEREAIQRLEKAFGG